MVGMKSDITNKCKDLLLSKKEELLNQSRTWLKALSIDKQKGDEIDQSEFLQNQNKTLLLQERTKKLLIEIDVALEKIKSDEFGICEYTGLSISSSRLLAIPWTRLSIEGAETIDQIRRKFKQHRPS